MARAASSVSAGRVNIRSVAMLIPERKKDSPAISLAHVVTHSALYEEKVIVGVVYLGKYGLQRGIRV